MISVSQLATALYGVWLLLKFDPRALDYFDKTPGGFARSFVAAGILAPLHLTHSILVYPPQRGHIAFAPYLIVQLLSYVLNWVCFPFAMLYVARILDREQRFLAYMVPYNWFQLPIALVFMPIALLADLGLLSNPIIGFVNLLLLTQLFAFGSFIARIGLQVGLIAALAVVVIDLLVTFTISEIIWRI